ncbi:hypothetical protein XENTR_v10011475 [Xenopus tropicalis]|nr:hypothetical protein XENTR_v10011475 [Xenopus tropicalis]
MIVVGCGQIESIVNVRKDKNMGIFKADDWRPNCTYCMYLCSQQNLKG